MSVAKIWFDGGSRPNPGHAGFGVLVQINGDEIEIGRYIGWATNNEAEFKGLIVALKVAKAEGATDIVITGDSLWVINVCKGEFHCKKDHLKGFLTEARNLLSQFDSYEFVHVRGHMGHEENERVDTLATNAILHGMTRKPNPFSKVGGLIRDPEGKLVDPFQ